jgi:hypothetical protein
MSGPPGAMPNQGQPKKLSMEDVNYRGAEGQQSCANCANFMGPDQCTLVDGSISASGMCDLWAAKQDQAAMMQQLFSGGAPMEGEM